MKLLDKNTHDTVEEMLNTYPATQDSDNYLTAMIWFKELMKMGWSREDIQKNKPNLRGKTYTKRQKNSNRIRKEIVKL